MEDVKVTDVRQNLPEYHAGTLERSLPGDSADRIIVATAMTPQMKLVTADDRLRQSQKVETIR